MQANEIDKDDPEFDNWLQDISETCIAHMYFMEAAEDEALSVEDFGLQELERAFLALYSMYKRGELGKNDKPH